SLPPDWQSYRDTWETAHAVTAGLAALAFVAVAVAIIWHRKSTLRQRHAATGAKCRGARSVQDHCAAAIRDSTPLRIRLRSKRNSSIASSDAACAGDSSSVFHARRYRCGNVSSSTSSRNKAIYEVSYSLSR